MSDLIDRQAKLKRIEKIRQGVLTLDDIHRASIIMNGMHLCEEAVRNQPSAQPEREKGKWVFSPDHAEGICTMCNFKIYGRPYNNTYLIVPYNYCPNCGARMDGERRTDETD